MKKGMNFLRVAVLLPVAFYCVSLCRCELLTAAHGHEFEGLDASAHMLEPSDRWKVLDYSGTEASVYYVGPGRIYGNVLRFSSSSGTGPWELTGWNTVWSRNGSADGFVWPYIR